MARVASTVFAGILLAACEGNLQTRAVVERIESVANEALEISESGVCRHSSVRAVLEAYPTRERIQQWFDFCYPQLKNPFGCEE